MKTVIKNLELSQMKILLLIFTLSMSLMACEQYGGYGEKLTYFKKGELYFTKTVTKDEAQKLGEFLVKEGFFSEDATVSVQLNKEGETYQFRMATMESARDKPETIEIMKAAAQEMSADVFDGKKVVVHLCDEYFTTLKIITP